jgi:hypothetical protein
MKTKISREILVNATRLTQSNEATVYEFILDDKLKVIELVHITALAEGLVESVKNYQQLFAGELFELNHVRVNPHLDNRPIIEHLSNTLTNIGIQIQHPPHPNDMALTYKPLGEIKDNVRFYYNQATEVTFLCPHPKLRLIGTQPKAHHYPQPDVQ